MQVPRGTYEPDQTVDYQCLREGFTLDSEGNLTCSITDGGQTEWSGDAPTCSGTFLLIFVIFCYCSERLIIL